MFFMSDTIKNLMLLKFSRALTLEGIAALSRNVHVFSFKSFVPPFILYLKETFSLSLLHLVKPFRARTCFVALSSVR